MNIQVAASDKYLLVKSPWGTTAYDNSIYLPRWEQIKQQENLQAEVVFQVEGGGYALDGHPHTNALLNYSI